MIDDTKGGRTLDRRGFLKGSALFAAVMGAAAAVPVPRRNRRSRHPRQAADKTEQPPASKKKPLLDKNGR
jgi:hypothetical protein